MSTDAVVCPKCPGSNMLEMKTSDHVALDFCGACNGLWFDANELAEYLGLSHDLMEFDAVKSAATATDLACPKCNSILFEIPFSTQSDMLIDLCPQCGGTFWDFREVASAQALAANQQSAAERLSLIKQRFFKKGFGD
ncbi:MAG: zf-TFIIB domain-containing protein [Gammaproteobacteria bacterium]